MMLKRILSGFDSASYCLLSVTNYDSARTHGAHALPATYHQIPCPAYAPRTFPLLRIMRRAAHEITQVYSRARHIAEILRREKSEALLACTGDLIDLPAGYLAARETGIPFLAYIFDDYVAQWVHPLRRLFARAVAWRIMSRADALIVPNEFLSEEYRRRYQVAPVVIHNPTDAAVSHTAPPKQFSDPGAEIRIVYTGYVYEVHFDAFRNLVEALRSNNNRNIRLHLYTSSAPELLKRMGIAGPVVFHSQVSSEEAQRLQQSADVLFLPLAFQSSYTEVIRTSAPGKMGEYLASGTPVLAHVPADSFVSWYFRKYSCGAVVDQPEPALLRTALASIVDQLEYRNGLVRNALARARADFCLSSARARFSRLFESEELPRLRKTSDVSRSCA